MSETLGYVDDSGVWHPFPPPAEWMKPVQPGEWIPVWDPNRKPTQHGSRFVPRKAVPNPMPLFS